MCTHKIISYSFIENTMVDIMIYFNIEVNIPLLLIGLINTLFRKAEYDFV